MRVGVITVSSSRELGDDPSGETLASLVMDAGHELQRRALVKDDVEEISSALITACEDCDLVLTTGGTGLTIDDVTPEATAAVCDRTVPGIAEALRSASAQHTPMAMLSRATAGTRGRTLIVNLPGSQAACRQCFAVLEPTLEHVAEQLAR